MTVGTKTLLIGLHQVLLHPLLMIVAFVRVHRRRPDLAEFVAILVHDWGYWGCRGIDTDGGENHPYLGARIMRKLYGERGYKLVMGHSSNTIGKEGIEESSIFSADKYYYVLLPGWFHWLLARASGEYKEYAASNPIGFDPWKHREMMKEKFAYLNRREEKPCATSVSIN